jgi:hypothetical protein
MTDSRTAHQRDITARVRISRSASNQEPYDQFVIRVEDQASGLLVSEVTMTPAEFALSIGSQVTDVPAKINQSPDIGRRLEVSETVLALDREDWDDKRGINALAFREFHNTRYDLWTAGWQLDPLEKRPNSRRWCDEGYRVTIRRYVTTDTDTDST